MSNFYAFAGDHPVCSVFLVAIIIQGIVHLSINLPNRIMRHWNIRKHGYPPQHCDADGDFKPADKEKNSERIKSKEN